MLLVTAMLLLHATVCEPPLTSAQHDLVCGEASGQRAVKSLSIQRAGEDLAISLDEKSNVISLSTLS
jgi:hypothetical protein